MGTNPMQKMKRNSTLTGVIIGLMIGLILCVCLYMFLTKAPKISGVDKENAISVSVLNKPIKSGTKITSADVTPIVVNRNTAPLDAVSLVDGEAIAKIDLSQGTVLGSSMLSKASQEIKADSRIQEYNMVTLPTQLSIDDFIDIRLQLPNGGDYIVVSKKQVVNCDSSTIWLQMNEEEILTMSNAIVEYYIMAGSKLYATVYSNAGTQEAAIPTYCPNSEVVALISGNNNITSEIVDGQGRFTQQLKNIRNNIINKAINEYSDSALENIEENIKEEIKTLKESREAYFGALNAAY